MARPPPLLRLVLRSRLKTQCTHHLSHRHRHNSTTTTTLPTSTSAHPPPPPTTAPPSLRRYRRAVLWATTSLTFGVMSGTMVSHTIAPPPHPEPGSVGDKILMRDLEQRIDAEFKVKVFRGRCQRVVKEYLGRDVGGWREVDWDGRTILGGEAGLKEEISERITEGVQGPRSMSEAMAGARGLGVQRSFWNSLDQESVAVIWFGGATSGWPGVVHGGGIATVSGDKISLAASLAKSDSDSKPEPQSQKDRNGNNEALAPLSPRPEPKQLELTYKKPTYANAFYVVRAFARQSPIPLVHGNVGEMEVEGRLETSEGVTTVECRGVVPTSGAQEVGGEGTAGAVREKAKGWVGWK